jgi:uncharacterized protein
MPRVLITGGTGLVGKTLTTHLIKAGYSVIILTRKLPQKASTNPDISYAEWDITKGTIDRLALSASDYIIHLAGAGVMDRSWTRAYKKEIVDSRVKSSELLVKTLKENTHNVKGVISASAMGWYGEDKANQEPFVETDPAADNFLGETCLQWERSIGPVQEQDIRLVKLRLGIVLGQGGALEEFRKPLRFGIATILGTGKQIISWIHIDDLCRMFIFAMENEQLSGNYNAVAPSPVSNKALVLELAQCMKGKFFIPVHVPQFAIKLILGAKSIEVLKSTTVSCQKIKDAGFTFLYPSLKPAIENLCKK